MSGDAARGIARAEQIGDALAVAGEPIGRQLGEAAAGERDDRFAGGPRTQHVGGRRTGASDAPAGAGAGLYAGLAAGIEAEIERQAIIVDVQPGREPALQREIAMGVAAQLIGAARGGLLEPGGERDRLRRSEPRRTVGPQAELAAQARDERLLRALVADRDRAASEGDEPTALDPRSRRIAVDDDRLDDEHVALAPHADLQPRLLAAARRRESLRLDLGRDPAFEGGQDLRHEQGEVAVAEEASARQIRELAPREPILGHRMQRPTRGQHDAVSEHALDPAILLDEEPHAARRVDDAGDEAEPFALDPDGPIVEKDRIRLREPPEQRREGRGRGRVGGAGGESLLDREVGGGRDEVGAALVTGGDGGEPAGQRRSAALELDRALEHQMASLVAQHVDDAPHTRAPLGQCRAGFLLAAQRDHAGGDVFAGSSAPAQLHSQARSSRWSVTCGAPRPARATTRNTISFAARDSICTLSPRASSTPRDQTLRSHSSWTAS